jgi:signal transduction histidine kinase
VGGCIDKANILIVDDLPEKLLVFKTVLEDLEQNLIMVRSGSEALREVLERDFAVILLDVNMPDIDGIETASLIRKHRKSAHTPIIFITAYADEMQTSQGYSLGAVDYILSPVMPDVLRSKVKVFVELYQAQQRTRLMAEEQVARARAEAGQRAAEELTRQLQEEARRKDEFLAMLAHELRNPLAPIRTAVEVIRRVAPPDPTLNMARDAVDRQVGHLVRLVDELLDVSRISEGRITLKKEQIELGKVIAHSVETARPLIESRGQRLSVTLPRSPLWLFGDGVRLAQVVANLLNNSAKYTPEGGRIEVAVSAHEGEAMVEVRDDGEGIEAQLLPRVFDLFVQGQRSLDRSQGGLGLGLTLVKRLVELHHGRVEAESGGPGRGSVFRIHLPCLAAVQGRHENISSIHGRKPQLTGRRVLVVDDNADAAETVAAYLRLEGHETKVVTEGAEVLGSARVFEPQVVVLDIGLPGLDGYQIARQLRAQPHTKDTLLIAVTGYGREEDRARAAAAGFDCHFVKPADPVEIQAAIERGSSLDNERDREPLRPLAGAPPG